MSAGQTAAVSGDPRPGGAAGGGAALGWPAAASTHPGRGPMTAPVGDLSRVMDVSGRCVIVTGAAAGIGFGIARAFAERGATVAVLDIDMEAGRAAVAKLGLLGGQHLFVACDVSDRGMVRRAVDTVHAAFGRIDVLVNNAGINAVKPFLDMDESLPEWHRVIDVDLHGPVNMTHAVDSKMRADRQGGLIINISSVGGARCSGSKDMPAAGYVAAKAAINHLTVSWAIEFADYDIRVNCIMPGPTHSRLDEQLTPEMKARNERMILARRYGEPLEIGALCVFMASAEGAHLNGVVIPHDGGYLCVN
ncbi:MAG: SDR family oxidoreductase [Actinomycetia bacterium]|nr:SDR family oxidoreductase [Actinomycetes bacterium]